MNSDAGDVVALVPAAGYGSRMGSDTPKQYLPLHGTTVLQCTLNRLFTVAAIKKIVVVIGAEDQLPDEINSDPRIVVTIGGDTRSDSVRNGLTVIVDDLKFNGPVLVHDAARPCVRAADIKQLITEVADKDHGGLLAIPVYDTLKKSDQQQQVSATIDREDVWRAVTPQLFQSALLASSLDQVADTQQAITDEASAMEQCGFKPQLIKSAQDNIKITESADLQLAQSILEAQERE